MFHVQSRDTGERNGFAPLGRLHPGSSYTCDTYNLGAGHWNCSPTGHHALARSYGS